MTNPLDLPLIATSSDVAAEKNLALDIALQQIADLESRLQEEAPDIMNYLQRINEQLRKFPELVYLLSDDDISVIVKAQTQKVFNYLDEKSKPKAKKKVEDISDLL